MDKNTAESTNKLLKVIIALLLRGGQDGPNLREQIATLTDLGLKPVEIAEILGRTSGYVNKELSGIRKNRKR
jgi:hypothetical protein